MLSSVKLDLSYNIGSKTNPKAFVGTERNLDVSSSLNGVFNYCARK